MKYICIFFHFSKLRWHRQLKFFSLENRTILSCTVNVNASSSLGAESIKRCHLTSIGNPIVEIRRSYDRLISTMGFPILVRRYLYIQSGPWWHKSESQQQWNWTCSQAGKVMTSQSYASSSFFPNDFIKIILQIRQDDLKLIWTLTSDVQGAPWWTSCKMELSQFYFNVSDDLIESK